MTIFVVVIVFGIAVGYAQSKLLSRMGHDAEAPEQVPSNETTALLVSDSDQPSS